MKVFMFALDSLGKSAPSVGKLPPTSDLVDKYFKDSTGAGDYGEKDASGPWNQGDGWKIVEAPALKANGPMR